MFDYKDQISFQISSGSGGSGAVSFFRTKINPRGGPDGGNGGQGGAVVFHSSPTVSGFEHLKKVKFYKAQSGSKGGNQLKNGKNGKDIIITIPMGTVIKNHQNQILRDFFQARKEIFLEGGQGGKGNTFFKNSLNQAPRRFQKGEKEKTERVLLELKPIIDVAIIGKVNTGKSSFFNLTTKAKSKVAVYPYTTLVPHIGQLKETRYFIMDIPGLEPGASKNIFKGLSFLRSLQRAKILLHFLDSSNPDILKDLKEIDQELKIFDTKHSNSYFEKLSDKKIFYILTKSDQLSSEKEKKDLIKKVKSKLTRVQKINNKKIQKLFLLSSKNKEGVSEILQTIEKECSQEQELDIE